VYHAKSKKTEDEMLEVVADRDVWRLLLPQPSRIWAGS